MRQAESSVAISDSQSASADVGMKGMIPIDRPFLDYVLSQLADGGITHVVLVIGPEHTAIREYFTQTAPPTRVSISFAIQAEPIGTANAVVAAADHIGAEPFLVLNADNLYPAGAIRELTSRDAAAAVAFDRDALLSDGAIEPERIRQFAVLSINDDNTLAAIVEKPGDSLDPHSDAARWVSMNLWALTPPFVDACRRVSLSARGEYELPEAIGSALQQHTMHVVRRHDVVLDLSHRRDISRVTERLRGVTAQP